MAIWHTLSTVRADWPDAAQLGDPALTELLAVAQAQVTAFAPALPADQAPGTIPDAWRLAQRMQARNIFTAGAVSAGGGIGDGSEFVIQPHPLDWTIKQLLRPKRGVPVVG